MENGERLPPDAVALKAGFPALCFLLFVLCIPALAQSEGERLGPLSVWQQSRQAQMEYIERLRQRLAAEPESVPRQIELGRAYYGLALNRDQQPLLEADKIFRQVLAREPRNPVALVRHGALLGMKIGFGLVPPDQIPAVAAQSVNELDRAVRLAPDSVEVREVRGYTSFYTPSMFGRDGLAIEDFTHVLELLEQIPNSERERADVHLILGDCYTKTGDAARARASWERARQLVPGSGTALAAEARLRSNEDLNEFPAGNLKELIAFFGFLIGTIIFAILTSLVARDLARTPGRRRGMVISLLALAAALSWNGVNLALVVAHAIGLTKLLPRLQSLTGHSLTLIAALLPILFGLVIAWRFYKATFMDIALKRGVALLVIVGLSLLYVQLVEAKLLSAFFRISNPALRSIFFIGIYVGLMMLYPPLRDRIYRLVDCRLFRRRDYSRLLDDFNERLRAAPDERSLLAAVTVGLREEFAAQSARWLPATDELSERLSSVMTEERSVVLLRQQITDERLEAELAKDRVELALAVRPDNEMSGVILIGPRAYGQAWLSEELSVLRAVSAQISRTLENLRLHEARRKHAIAEEELRRLVAQSELKALRAQIDPHLFFNALNSVSALIGDDPAAAEELLEDLSDLFRHSFKQSREFIELGEELALVETYLKVEKVRLGDKLQFNKAVLAEALHFKIPALTIQPLVENAVRHGLAKHNGGGVITLSAAVRNEGLNVSVADTGAGIAASALPQLFTSGVGLSNVNDRLRRIYGEQTRLQIDSAPGQGTTVSFVIPHSDKWHATK